MSITMPLEAAVRDLRRLLEELEPGETVTLTGAEGEPEALLVSLKQDVHEAEAEADYEARWDELSPRVSRAWRSDRSAVELVTEMRR